jgi:hypothetical protein
MSWESGGLPGPIKLRDEVAETPIASFDLREARVWCSLAGTGMLDDPLDQTGQNDEFDDAAGSL